eukprot:11365394-Alexandrium_andersonii.AAC.1
MAVGEEQEQMEAEMRADEDNDEVDRQNAHFEQDMHYRRRGEAPPVDQEQAAGAEGGTWGDGGAGYQAGGRRKRKPKKKHAAAARSDPPVPHCENWGHYQAPDARGSGKGVG